MIGRRFIDRHCRAEICRSTRLPDMVTYNDRDILFMRHFSLSKASRRGQSAFRRDWRERKNQQTKQNRNGGSVMISCAQTWCFRCCGCGRRAQRVPKAALFWSNGAAQIVGHAWMHKLPRSASVERPPSHVPHDDCQPPVLLDRNCQTVHAETDLKCDNIPLSRCRLRLIPSRLLVRAYGLKSLRSIIVRS